MCEAEEVLSWLLAEVEQKPKDCLGSVKGVVRVLQDDVDFESRYDEDRAVDAVIGLEGFGDELLGLVREAKQRLKESKRQVAA
ncbi:MAG: hypothetical protein AB7D27_11490 [Desulfomicrobium sp.]